MAQEAPPAWLQKLDSLEGLTTDEKMEARILILEKPAADRPMYLAGTDQEAVKSVRALLRLTGAGHVLVVPAAASAGSGNVAGTHILGSATFERKIGDLEKGFTDGEARLQQQIRESNLRIRELQNSSNERIQELQDSITRLQESVGCRHLKAH